MAEVIRDRLEVSARLQAVLEGISAINLELLSRQELEYLVGAAVALAPPPPAGTPSHVAVP